MRIAYANTYYRIGHSGGAHVHMEQFVANAVALGHEIWAWPQNQYPNAQPVPTGYLSLIKCMRRMDVLYVRLERSLANTCRWAVPPHRLIYGFPVVVWEFNTTPEFGLLRGKTEEQVNGTIRSFRHFGRGCDLAICVSSKLADYVRNQLGIQRVLAVPNGSDPELFHPDAAPAEQIKRFENKINIVWIGSADIPWHNIDLLFKTASQILDHIDGNKFQFHIFGKSPAGITGGMPENVHYWAEVPYFELPNWLATMNIGLILNHPGPADYGSPLKLFDYMACGLTVIGTEQPQVREVLNQLGGLDLLVSANDPEGLSQVIQKLAEVPHRIQKLGVEGRQLVVEHYNWRRAVQDTMDAIKTILAEKGKRKP